MERMPSSQYHHYIPRFLLRRFALPPSPGTDNGKKRNKRPQGNEVINAVNLDKNLPEISTVPVNRVFGQTDMYKDDSKFSIKEQLHVEQKLCHIEQTASRIIARVIVAHKTGKEDITLSRSDKDVLHKFMFVMKYRCPIFFRRFNHQTAEDYDANDRDKFLEYMRMKNFKRPLDVWFDNLTKIIDKPMDPAGTWTLDLVNQIYPGDAIWLFSIVHFMNLSFVTPSNLSDEFLLTENAFGIHEGPVSYSVNPMTGERTQTAYTEFHVLAVISPHLAMVLRDHSLSGPLEDRDDNMRKHRKAMLAMDARQHNDPEHATTSLLHDLPVAKARKSNNVVKNGRLALADGADGEWRATDTYTFPFFHLESRHVQTINTVMLDQAHCISTLIFKSEPALRRALEFYLSYPTNSNGIYSLKTIRERQDDKMLLLFRKLEHLARLLGSDVKAIYHIDPLQEDDDTLSFDEVVAEVLKTVKPITPNNPISLSMTVLADVVKGLKFSIRTLHALDHITDGEGRPSYPVLVFRAVQSVDPLNLSPYAKDLPKVKLDIWRLGWDALVDNALLVSGANLEDDVNAMLGNLAQFGVGPSPTSLAAFARLSPQQASRTEQKNTGAKEAAQFSGLSKRGLSNAFNNIGRDIQKQETSLHHLLLKNSGLPNLDSSSRLNNSNSNSGAAGLDHNSTQLGPKKDVENTASKRRIDSRLSTNPNERDAGIFVFLIGLFAWYYFWA